MNARDYKENTNPLALIGVREDIASCVAALKGKVELENNDKHKAHRTHRNVLYTGNSRKEKKIRNEITDDNRAHEPSRLHRELHLQTDDHLENTSVRFPWQPRNKNHDWRGNFAPWGA